MNYSSSSERVAAALRAWITDRPTGARLPATREISRDHGVGPVTVQRAVQTLVAAGLVETRPGTGSFVAPGRSRGRRDTAWQAAALGPGRPTADGRMGSGMRTIPPETIPMNTGYLGPDLLAADLSTSALVRAARDPRALRPAPANGLPELREALVRSIDADAPGAEMGQDDLVVTSGGQSALVTAFRALTRPGDVIVMESPTFWGAIAAATEAGLVIAPVASGPDGPDPAHVAEVVAAHRARIFYAQPTHANPTGRSWSADVRREVLELARAQGFFVVEDDWARDLPLKGSRPAHPPLVAHDTDGHVVHIRSLTKSMSPSIRVGTLAAKGPALQRIRESRWAADLYVPSVLQVAAVDVLTRPAWPRHLRRLGSELTSREAALRSALLQLAPAIELDPPPTGGLSLWVRIPRTCDSADVADACLHAGLAISPGAEWYPADENEPRVRLSYAAAPVDTFESAARILQSSIEAALS